jgi:hypothetical protein
MIAQRPHALAAALAAACLAGPVLALQPDRVPNIRNGSNDITVAF